MKLYLLQKHARKELKNSPNGHKYLVHSWLAYWPIAICLSSRVLHQPLQLRKLRLLFISLKSKVSLLGEVDRTERRKCTKFTRRSQTSRKSTKRVRDFSGKESIRDCGEGDWVQKIPCQWTPPPPSGIVLSMI